MWIGTGFVFASLSHTPFRFLIFNYTDVESDLGLCGFLSFLTATAFAQAMPKYICLAVILVIVSAALPAYSQTFFANIGVPQTVTPTLANAVNILVQVGLSYPAMKFWVMPKEL